MSKLGKYCKAYMIDDLRQFSGWSEGAEMEKQSNVSTAAETVDDMNLNDILFLQENYIVTAGIFLDENVVFDKVTPEWIEFCRDTLKFEVPVIEPGEGESAQSSSAGL